jgi:hypothetical protein
VQLKSSLQLAAGHGIFPKLCKTPNSMPESRTLAGQKPTSMLLAGDKISIADAPFSTITVSSFAPAVVRASTIEWPFDR